MHECPPFQRQTPAPLPHAPRCRRRGWNPGCRRLSRMPETWARRHSLSYEWIGAALRTIAGVLACPVALGRCAAGSVTTSRVATLPAAARCAHGRPPPGIKHHHPPTCSHTSPMPTRHAPPPPPHTHTQEKIARLRTHSSVTTRWPAPFGQRYGRDATSVIRKLAPKKMNGVPTDSYFEPPSYFCSISSNARSK